MLERKTRAYIVRGSARGRRQTPCFINGRLPRNYGVTKVFVYYFNENADLIITAIPVKFVQMAEFTLEG